MKAISLLQPWATLVAIGAKRIETRSWCTSYRGPLAIHASKSWTKDTVKLAFTDPFKTVLRDAGYKLSSSLPRGKIIAMCELVSMQEITPSYFFGVRSDWKWVGPDGRQYRYELDDQERIFGDYTPGRYAWLLDNIKRLDQPMPAKGKLGLWEWDAIATCSSDFNRLFHNNEVPNG